MPYKVVSQLNRNGQLYKPGEIISDLDAEAAKELLSYGVIEDTEAAASETNTETPPAPSAEEEQQLERGTVDSQVNEAVKKDLADNERLAQTPGEVIVNNKPSGIVAKAKAALSGDKAPSAEEIAKDPQLQQ
jgi:hypothetical protein